MSVDGMRIQIQLEDENTLVLDRVDAWEGFYVLDASMTPPEIIEDAKAANERNTYGRVTEERMKLFVRVRDVIEGDYLRLSVGEFSPGTTPPLHWAASGINVGRIKSVRAA